MKGFVLTRAQVITDTARMPMCKQIGSKGTDSSRNKWIYLNKKKKITSCPPQLTVITRVIKRLSDDGHIKNKRKLKQNMHQSKTQSLPISWWAAWQIVDSFFFFFFLFSEWLHVWQFRRTRGLFSQMLLQGVRAIKSQRASSLAMLNSRPDSRTRMYVDIMCECTRCVVPTESATAHTHTHTS